MPQPRPDQTQPGATPRTGQRTKRAGTGQNRRADTHACAPVASGRTELPFVLAWLRNAVFLPAPAARLAATGLVATLFAGGCHHQDPVDATFDWVHHMRGGAIATQRPPPPGRYDPYPL
ncbi:MAG: hypothetical protein ABF502_08590, partial [Acetobacter sp.]